MAINWLKKALGVNELENRISYLEKDKANLEMRLVSSNEQRELIIRTATNDAFVNAIEDELDKVKVGLINKEYNETNVAINAATIVEKYDFKRYAPRIHEDYPSAVISIKEFSDNPEKYLHKLTKGFLSFPLNLNFDQVNKMLRRKYGNAEIDSTSRHSNNGTIQFAPQTVLSGRYDNTVEKTCNELIKATELSDLTRCPIDSWVVMDTIDFLANYEGLFSFFANRPELETKQKENAVSLLTLLKGTLYTAIEILSNTKIKDSSELLVDFCYDVKKETPDERIPVVSGRPENLKEKIEKTLLSNMNGFTYYDINRILPIRSKERFKELAAERTIDILARDREYKGLTKNIKKTLDEYTVSESIVLACYFARNIITNYESLDDAVAKVLNNQKETKMSGKCTDYTGLALHYLREYIIPLNPEKFRNFQFGYDTDMIGDYNHCYMKVVREAPDGSHAVYFLDPTKLANEGIKALKTPEEILEKTSASNLPLQITRDAEDFLLRTVATELNE